MDRYTHDEEIKKFAKEIGCNPKEVIDLSSNINFIKPKINTNFNSLDISSYPNYDKLYKLIAKNHGVKKSEIELFNGGSSAIFSIFSHLNLFRVTIYSPAYLEYKRAAKMFGYEINCINRFDDLYASVPKNSLVIFVNPSTPDGKLYDLDELFEIWKEAEATVLLDESFLDFSAASYLYNYEKLYVLKSMTKFYSSAGVRIGAIISTKKNIKDLKSTQPPWKLSQFDISYISAALKDSNFGKKSKIKNYKNRKYLYKILKKSKLFSKVFNSDANFILAKLKKFKADKFQKKLNRCKILIRNCSNFDFLDDSYVRIAVKSKKDLKTFKRCIT
jgi:threonine-phosphate decarboxylase